MNSDRRLLLVHAHPDDESIATGATMAKYAAEGARVTLVTCTLGEQGEILRDDVTPAELPGVRHGELAEALAALGVGDHRYLGGQGAHRDSGMEWGPGGAAQPLSTLPDGAFWAADLTEAADELVQVIRELRPQVLITYDPFGNYGHPDHIQAHRVAMYGAQLAGVASHRPEFGEPWTIGRIFWTANPGEDCDVRVDAGDFLAAKTAAMAAHRTQLTIGGGTYALSNGIDKELTGLEGYRLAVGELGESAVVGDLFG